MKLYIIGGGTLSKFIIDILESFDGEIGGVFDDNFPELNKVCGYNVLGRVSDIGTEHEQLAIGMGEPALRKQIYQKYKKTGHIFPAIIHKTCVVSNTSRIGEGAIIGPFSGVLSGTEIGNAVCMLSGVQSNQDVTIGDFSLIGAGVNIGNGAVLGEGCHVSMSHVIRPKESIPAWSYVDG